MMPGEQEALIAELYNPDMLCPNVTEFELMGGLTNGKTFRLQFTSIAPLPEDLLWYTYTAEISRVFDPEFYLENGY